MSETKYKNARRIIRVIEFAAALSGSLALLLGIYDAASRHFEELIFKDIPSIAVALIAMAVTHTMAAILDIADTNRGILCALQEMPAQTKQP